MLRFWPKIRLPVQISFSFISLVWVVHVLRKIDWTVTRESLNNISIPLLTACFFLVGLIYLTRLFRLRYWVQRLPGRKLSTREWTDLYLKSMALGSITPARLGDFSRITLLSKTGLSLGARSKVTFHDKMVDVLYVPMGICLTSDIVGNKLNVPPIWIFSGGMLSLIIFLLLSYWFARFLGIAALLAGWAMTVSGLGLYILSNTFIFWSVGIQLSMLEVAAITLSVGIVGSLPISVGGIGIRESSLLCLLGLWGIRQEAIPPVLFLEFIFNIVFPVMLYLSWALLIDINKG
ncbi:MAG: lysylphosphatidylglycerol synthase domain-containing protein [Thermodesulfobacteriota bacterium]|nr:lysylphosphatidylglycerol synthase domain-containing protein [Thermodesulfobacteriota bacterium]